MKKKILREVEVDICEECHKETGLATECLNCRATFCLGCREKMMAFYPHGVFVEGTMDGYYCKKPCDIELHEDESDAMHEAYSEVRSLKLEYECWWMDFDKRRKVAEAEVGRLYGERRKAR